MGRVPVKSWCDRPDAGTLIQIAHLASHPKAFHHVALMPDGHVGFGMPIGGVLACTDALLPNAVGVDIGCGMIAVRTSWAAERLTREDLRGILDRVKRRIPLGEGHAHGSPQRWERLDAFTAKRPWRDDRTWDLAFRNLGTLGGGNHFIELQAGDDGRLWLMIHSGSRNLGLKIAQAYHRAAQDLNRRMRAELPSPDLAFLPDDSGPGREYLEDMQLALDYALENRRRMMVQFRGAAADVLHGVEFDDEINIHHNYAARERHFGREVWVHRKGATRARPGERGIIPGSMGTPSFIVCGRGNPESFQSCAHGAGRTMGRSEACRVLDRAACDRAMQGIVFDGWRPLAGGRDRSARGRYDLEEAPAAYKDIEQVMRAQQDLVEPVVRLRPLGVVKG